MKGSHIYVVLAIILLFGFTSCATTYMPLSQVPDAQELGPITASFEKNIILGSNFVGTVGIGLAGGGGALLGIGIVTLSPPLLAVGGIAAGAGLGVALIGELIEAPKRKIVNEAAREALLTAARSKYTEDIDVRDIRVTYVRPSGSTHLYNATGVVIKKEN